MLDMGKLELYAKDSELLIVEDETILAKIIEKAFSSYFANIVTAKNGQEALEKYKDNCGFDIIVTDINMPVMNGLELCKAIRCLNKEQSIIVLSGLSDESHFIEFIELGVDSFMLKPFEFNKLASKMLTILQSKSQLKIIEEYQREQLSSLKSSKEKDKMLIQQSKLAVMGEMIGLISHQWRQPLSVISVLASGIAFKKGLNKLSDDELLTKTTEIKDVTSQMGALMDEFSTFFRPPKFRIIVDVEELVNSCVSLMHSVLDSLHIEVEVTADENVRTKLFDGEFKQVIINLLANARDALVANKEEGRKIIINIFNDDIDNAISIFVKDNGGGIESKVIERVFEPYFSTKSKNGTGLGLYMCKAIVEEHLHGKIEVFNDDEGAVFKIELPLEK
jgi:signal transduction histidine kinase